MFLRFLHSIKQRSRRKSVAVAGYLLDLGKRIVFRVPFQHRQTGLSKLREKAASFANTPDVQARRAEKTRQHNRARWGWSAASQPTWLTSEFYETRIQPLLSSIPRTAIMNANRGFEALRWLRSEQADIYRTHGIG